MESAKARRSALRKLLAAGQATSQDELVRLLGERGHAVTQSTVSRDLKLLGAQRVLQPGGEYGYQLRQSHVPSGFPTDMVSGVEHNEVCVVVRTKVGRAQAVGLELDALRIAGVLGTIAGDDTVVVIPRSITQTEELARKLRALVGAGG
jgi:transcriptional regulator of arginine metabolism